MKRVSMAIPDCRCPQHRHFLLRRAVTAADTDFTIYFENSSLPLKSKSLNRTVYLPLIEIVKHLNLPYTDDFRLETFTVGNPSARIVTTRNSALISVDDQIVLLQNPVRRDEGIWLVPLDFLSQGVSRIAGIEFRYRPGASRIFAGNVNPAELVMNAQALGPMTRLTLRTGTAVGWDLRREPGQRRAILTLKGKPVDPLRERLDYKDRLLESVNFDDSDGVAKLLINTSDDVREIRTAAADENRVYFVDFLREAAVTEAVPPPALTPPPAVARPDAPSSSLRVIVIDAGHGGIDDRGTASGGILEKDLTLAIARKLRSEIQSRLGATVLLTRDSDVALTSEARSAVANNNQAGLLISLHVGYSANTMDSGSSIYLIQEGFAANLSTTSSDRLFLPWYLAYRTSRQSSEQIATILQQELSKALPVWRFPIRSGPIAVLASATMPAVAIEVGNLNNALNAQTLTEGDFQTKLATAVAMAVEQFSALRSTGRP